MLLLVHLVTPFHRFGHCLGCATTWWSISILSALTPSSSVSSDCIWLLGGWFICGKSLAWAALIVFALILLFHSCTCHIIWLGKPLAVFGDMPTIIFYLSHLTTIVVWLLRKVLAVEILHFVSLNENHFLLKWSSFWNEIHIPWRKFLRARWKEQRWRGWQTAALSTGQHWLQHFFSHQRWWLH